MPKSARRLQEIRCLKRLREAGRCDGEARFARENDMPAAGAIWAEMARDQEQMAEAELRDASWTADVRPTPLTPLRADYEARLEHYLSSRKLIAGPLALTLGEVDARTRMWAV